ncbi:phosphorylase [Desulfovibrio sp. JC010]|uniref:phosphorylase family protein n=1 Tax=Desulfovibrio sp. JC010 TaxID=2593641 RepID=UPI0013D2F247|nr:phosphorylase [Desulfovibrio sp. JC010]NDV25515.1 phosphorylase [Desulfovibrio sp. JC010]
MTIKKIAIVAAMGQEALALCPNPKRGTSGNYPLLTGNISSTIEYSCIVSGIGIRRASEAAKLLCAEKPDLIMSIGVSGGLAADLHAGSLVAASSIGSDLTEFEAWSGKKKDVEICTELIPGWAELQSGKLITARRPLLTTRDKSAMHKSSKALAVDMESIAVAQAAKQAGIPFGCIRAISDDSKRSIPEESLIGVDESGKTKLGPILKAIAKRPGLIFELVPVGRDYSKALKSLGKVFK